MPPFEVPPAPPPPNRTLSHFYTSQTSLLNFLPSLFPPTFDLQLLLPEDPPAFHDFLSQTLVCLEPGYQIRTWNQIDPFEGTTSISEVSSLSFNPLPLLLSDPSSVLQILNRAIVSLFKSSKDGKPSNQLTNGFTSSSYGYSVRSSPSPSPSPAPSPPPSSLFCFVLRSSPPTPTRPSTTNDQGSTANMSIPIIWSFRARGLGETWWSGELQLELVVSFLSFTSRRAHPPPSFPSVILACVELVPDRSTTSSRPPPSSSLYRTSASLRLRARR